MNLNLKLKIWAMAFMITGLIYVGCSGEVKAGSIAPDFNLNDLSGNYVSLKQYRGSIVLLDFWATWCPPCRISIPELVDLQRRYKDKGVVILGISTDNPQRVNDRYLLAFKEKFRMNYKILRANDNVIQDYFSTPNIGIPTMFVINREGKIVDKHEGFRPGAVERSIKKLMP